MIIKSSIEEIVIKLSEKPININPIFIIIIL